MAYIRINGVSKRYGEKVALDQTDLEVRQGEFLSILGPSGCGKTTLLNILSGVLSPTTGRVEVGGKDLFQALPTVKVGYVFQEPRILPWRTVGENVRLGLLGKNLRDNQSRQQQNEVVRRHLKMVGLEECEKAWPLTLSGGQKHRIGIARALAVDPDYVLMDEPFSTLDEMTSRRMRAELLTIWEKTGKTIIFVTHDISEAVFLSERILLMTSSPGRVFDVVQVDIPRPRDYRAESIYKLEHHVMTLALSQWENLPD